MLKPREITKEMVAQRVARALRQHVGRGKEYGYADFADLVETDQRTVESWVRGETSPHLFAWLRCAAVLPACFAAETVELVGLVGLHEADGEACSLTVNRLASELTALIAQHLEDDGKIDHREEAIQEPVVRALAKACQSWLARRANKGA